MKKLIVAVLFLLSFTLLAQDQTEQWNGALDLGGMQLRLVVNINQTADGLNATLDSPDQKAFGIPISQISFDDDSLKFAIEKIGAKYAGAKISENKIVGSYNQSGREFPLVLVKSDEKIDPPKRPQEPKGPYPYRSEDITFNNTEAAITLAGTITIPEGDKKFPAVVLISGSGPQDRNEELMGHKPFLVLADFLTKNGIAVLRFDDRGVGDSQGNFKEATSPDFASDVRSAVNYLKDRSEVDNIGLIGHSEGGLIAPMVAADDKDIDFIVLMAGPGIRGDQILVKQQALIMKANGESDTNIEKATENNSKIFKMIVDSEDVDQLRIDMEKELSNMVESDSTFKLPQGTTKEQFIKGQIDQITTPWFRYFMKYDPQPTLAKVKCPVLAINGELDLQVPAKENLEAIKKALNESGNKDVTIKEIPALNHLFQSSTTGAPSEYATIEETFSPIAMEIIRDWINNLD